MLRLTKDNTATPDFYSFGDASDPITIPVTLDGSGGSVIGTPSASIFVWADNLNGDLDPLVGSYTGVSVTMVSEEGGDWELSLDGATLWGNTISVMVPSVAASFQAVQIYLRSTVANNGTIATQKFTALKLRLAGTEVAA